MKSRQITALLVVSGVLGWPGFGIRSAPTTTEQVAIVGAPVEGPEIWPRWRGPSGQGQVEGDGYVDVWSDTLNVLWKVEVPGKGNSSPIVLGDRVFLTTAYEVGRRRSILCFRRSNGEKLWETFVPDTDPESAHGKNGHASGTPTTDGERVYAYLGNHGLLAVDLEGRRVWHREMGPFNAFHGTACSPLLYENLLIVVQDHRGKSGSNIIAFDRKSGEEIWRTPRDAKVGWNSPIAIRVGDHDEVIMSGQQRVTAYDPETGRELWHARGNSYEAIPSPVVGHGFIFCSSGRAGPTIAIRPGGSGDVTETHIVWKTPKGSPFVPSPVLDDGYLYIVNDMTAIATCFRAETGEVAWQGRLGEAKREGFSGSPIAVNGRVFFTNDEGETFVLRSGPQFELLHVNRLNEKVLATPALVSGRWYFRTERNLLAIGDLRSQ